MVKIILHDNINDFFFTESDKKHIFVNNITLDKVDKKRETKTTPHANVKISAYDKIVQLVTNDNAGVKPQQEEQQQKYIVFKGVVLFFVFKIQ